MAPGNFDFDHDHDAGTRLAGVERIRAFVLAGAAVFTIRSQKTGTRFTYQIRQADAARGDGSPPHFVSVLIGPDNTKDYAFLGTIFDGRNYHHGRKSKIGPDAPSAVAFEFFWRCVLQGAIPDALEVRHAGLCGRCGRRLTVPSSIEIGLGPTCQEK